MAACSCSEADSPTCDMLGEKRALIAGFVGSAVASAIGGLSTSFTMLLIARVAQGAFAALRPPSALSLLNTTFTVRAERNRAFGAYGAIAGAGGGIGLVLGGSSPPTCRGDTPCS